MRAVKAAIAVDPRAFGRRVCAPDAAFVPAAPLSADVKLFATTFVAGFLFVSILLA
jgi:hypothetical protein